MIPTIGIMIGAYIILRCVELMCTNEGRFASPGAKIVVVGFAVITMLAASLSIYDLLHMGSAPIPKFNPPEIPGLR